MRTCSKCKSEKLIFGVIDGGINEEGKTIHWNCARCRACGHEMKTLCVGN